MSAAYLTAWENFLEKIAEVLAVTLTDNETQYILQSFRRFTERVREISSHNLKKLALEAETKRKFCQHRGMCRNNCFRGFTRAFSSALVVKYAVAVAQSLLTGQLRKRPSMIWSLMDRDTLRFALFFGSFIGGFKGVNCLMRKWRQTEDRLNSFVAGSVAGLALLIDVKSRRSAVMLYLLARALQSGVYALQKRQLVPHVPHGETLLMGVLNSQIIYAFMCEPTALARSYQKWIYDLADLQHYYGAAQAKQVMKCLTLTANGQPIDSKLLSPLLARSNEVFAAHQTKSSLFARLWTILRGGSQTVTKQHAHTFCALVHPETLSCTHGSFNYAQRVFPKALRLYLPLNIALMLLWRIKLLQKEPLEFMRRLVKSSLRSSTFITCFAALAWLPPCYFRNLLGREWHPAYAINGLLSGCTVILEQPVSRRIELALYCLPRALESLFKLAVARQWLGGRIRPVKHGEVALFSLSMGWLMTVYQTEQDVLPANVRPVFVRLFGIN